MTTDTQDERTCALDGCEEPAIVGAHYCSPRHEEKAARLGTRVTGPPADKA